MEANIVITGASGNETNSGFVHELILLDVTDVEYFNDPDMEADPAYPFTIKNEGIGVKVSAMLYKMKFRTKACSFSEMQSLVPEGQNFQLSITWDFPKNKEDIISFVWKNKHKRWMAIFKDTNGTCYVAGDMENGLFLTMSRSISSQNMISMQLSGRTWHPTWLIETMDVIGFADAQFSSAFSFDFKS